jgi:hypothetical protein
MIRWIATLVVAALVAYFAAIGSIRVSISDANGRVLVIDQREQDHFDELKNRLQSMEVHQAERFNELKSYMQIIVDNGADAKTGEPYRIQGQR